MTPLRSDAVVVASVILCTTTSIHAYVSIHTCYVIVVSLSQDGKKIQTLNNQTGKAVTQFFKTIKSKPGKALTALHGSSLNATGLNFVDILKQISEEHSFEVSGQAKSGIRSARTVSKIVAM